MKKKIHAYTKYNWNILGIYLGARFNYKAQTKYRKFLCAKKLKDGKKQRVRARSELKLALGHYSRVRFSIHKSFKILLKSGRGLRLSKLQGKHIPRFSTKIKHRSAAVIITYTRNQKLVGIITGP